MERYVSAFGLFVMIGLAWLMSSQRWRVNWRLVAMGLLLQFAFAWLTLKTAPGRELFAALGVLFSKVLDFVDAGSEFVFGKSFQSFYFAFKVLPTIIFFSSLMSVLYHVGVMQRIVQVMAWVMQRTMRTSGAESLSAAQRRRRSETRFNSRGVESPVDDRIDSDQRSARDRRWHVLRETAARRSSGGTTPTQVLMVRFRRMPQL